MSRRSKILFHEEQPMRQLPWVFWPVVIIMLGMAVAALVGLVQELATGGSYLREGSSGGEMLITYGVAVVISIAILLLMLSARLIAEVRSDGLFIRYVPFHLRPKQIPLRDLVEHRAETYHPVREFGGWGVRMGFGRKRAYNVSGNRGVRLIFEDGQQLVIGSREPERLNRAIAKVLARGK